MVETRAEAEAESPTSRPRWLLGVGATLGLVLATAGIVETAPGRGELPEGAAAIVNGSIIRESSYQRALGALAQDSRDPLSESDREHILNRLIEEELLVQRAVDLGLDKTDPVVRNTLVSALIETIVAGVGQHEPSEEKVAAFYEANRDFFARTDRFWVRQLRFPVAAIPAPDPAKAPRDAEARAESRALERAREGATRLRNGEELSALARELGAGGVVPLPDGYLPAAKLREYLGPTPAGVATGMQTGEVSDPIRGGSAWHVLQMVERVTNPPLPLSAVESQVRSEIRRRAGDESLRAYLDQLRAEAEIRLPPS